MSQIFDFAVVGSGVSGGRIAHQLTKAGAKVLLLEAGPHLSAQTFPGNELDYSSQMFWGGGLEMSSDGRLGLIRAKCVGGTSVVNQALLNRFDDIALASWKEASGIDFFQPETLQPIYETIEQELSISEIPREHYNKNTHNFIDGFSKQSLGWKPLNRAQTNCKLDQGSDCIVCLGGCPRNSKQSSLVVSIEPALREGLSLESEFQVQAIKHQNDQVEIIGSQRGNARTVICKKLVLAAGALGNSQILLRSQFGQKLPALGKKFCCHPQYMTYALFSEPVDAHKGAFQAVQSEDPKLRAVGIKLENVYAPPIATALLLPGIGKQHHRMMKKYRYMSSMEVAIRDDASGRIVVDRSGNLIIHKGLTRDDKAKARYGLNLIRDIYQSLGAREIISCPQTFGLHLMGGCSIGADGSDSVVNPEFTVQDHPNIYIADSSIFPNAPGINPSLTIMAMSQMALQRMMSS